MFCAALGTLSNSKRQYLQKGTVEPRLNEVPRDWGNSFVISRVR